MSRPDRTSSADGATYLERAMGALQTAAHHEERLQRLADADVLDGEIENAEKEIIRNSYGNAIENFQLATENGAIFSAQELTTFAKTRMKLGQYHEAIQLFDQVIELSGGFSVDPSLLHLRGKACLSAGMTETAIKNFTDAQKILSTAIQEIEKGNFISRLKRRDELTQLKNQNASIAEDLKIAQEAIKKTSPDKTDAIELATFSAKLTEVPPPTEEPAPLDPDAAAKEQRFLERMGISPSKRDDSLAASPSESLGGGGSGSSVANSETVRISPTSLSITDDQKMDKREMAAEKKEANHRAAKHRHDHGSDVTPKWVAAVSEVAPSPDAVRASEKDRLSEGLGIIFGESAEKKPHAGQPRKTVKTAQETELSSMHPHE